MLRLTERQLHSVLLLILGAGVVLFAFFGMEQMTKVEEQASVYGMEELSDGWICSYETNDMQKLQEYQKSQSGKTDSDSKLISEIISIPASLPVEEGTTLQMLRKMPDLSLHTSYLLIYTNRQKVSVSVENEVIYESSEKDNKVKACHVVPLEYALKNKTLVIKLTGQWNTNMEVQTILLGDRNALWIKLLRENGVSLVVSSLLLVISVCMLLVWCIVQNTWQQKRLLLYGSLEGACLAVLFLAEGTLLPVLSGINFGVAMIRVSFGILAALLHLMVIRCFVYKKRVISLVDIGILAYSIFYVSVMVLQAFSLIGFDVMHLLVKILFALGILLYTIALGVTIYKYGRREGIPVFYANMILLLCVIAQGILQLSGRSVTIDNIYIPLGFFLYTIFVGVLGLRQALFVVPKEEELPYDEEMLRAQLIEQLNPNLLFAAFHTLQNLIKSGSENSVKMIYYISVYLRDNLRALERSGESIPFEEELEHILAYLQLQKVRNANLEFALECKVKEFRVPRYSLEPMVENAVKHGIAGRNKGNIVIRTYLRAEGYAVQVIDDGIGFEKKKLRRHSKTALLCLFDLLEQQCQAQTEVVSREGKGTVITVIFPMLENELMDEMEDLEHVEEME